MKTIVVIDTVWLGHVPTYHKILVSRFLALGHRVISLSPDKQKMIDWAKTLPESIQKSSLDVGEVSKGRSQTADRSWRMHLARLFNMKTFMTKEINNVFDITNEI